MDDFGQGGAFVLGGSGGLGRSICIAFARVGVDVALTSFTNTERGEATAAAVREYGVRAHLETVDGSDEASLADALEAASNALGGLHSIIYAGGPPFDPQFFSRTESKTWRHWLDHDVMAAINLATLGLPYLRQTQGSFTAISTYQGDLIEFQGGTSAVSKAAVDKMVKVIAKEEGRNRVRANSVRCGWIAGPLVDGLFTRLPDLQTTKTRAIPLGRLGTSEEVGDIVVFLSSRKAGFITGVNLTADGGESL